MRYGALLAVLWTLAASEPTERNAKVVVCVQLTNIRVDANEDKIAPKVEASPFSRERVMAKIMIGMIARCADTIPFESVNEIIVADDSDSAAIENLKYAELALGDYLTEEQVTLTEEEEKVVIEVQALVQESEELRGKPLPAEPPTKARALLQGVYLLAVFGLFAALVVCGIKRLRKTEAASQKRKRR